MMNKLQTTIAQGRRRQQLVEDIVKSLKWQEEMRERNKRVESIYKSCSLNGVYHTVIDEKTKKPKPL